MPGDCFHIASRTDGLARRHLEKGKTPIDSDAVIRFNADGHSTANETSVVATADIISCN